MNDADLRLLKLVRAVDEERQRRLKVQQELNAARATIARLQPARATLETMKSALEKGAYRHLESAFLPWK